MGKNSPEDKVEGDVIECSLKKLMYDFGELMGFTANEPFVNNQIEIISNET